MRWIDKFRKSAAGAPEEQPGAATNAQTPGVSPPDQKKDSLSEELPGENPDPEGEFYGQGDMAQTGKRQPILDYTPCQWMAQQLMQNEQGAPQGAIAQTREGQMLVSCEVCRSCEWEKGCYGYDDDGEEKIQERRVLKQAAVASGLGIDPAMPDILVAEKVARLKLASEEETVAHLRKCGYTVAGAEYILSMSKRLG